MKWYTISKYVDNHTGEIMDKQTVKEEYRIINKIVEYKQKEAYGTKYTERTITHICTNEGTQRKLKFD